LQQTFLLANRRSAVQSGTV